MKKYEKAPISELIIGFSYDKVKINLQSIFKLQGVFNEEFPTMEIAPPVAIEQLEGARIVRKIDSSISGPFHIQLRSADNKWFLHLQQDRLYLNWIRNDLEEVGNYIGFTAFKNKFDSIISKINSSLSIDMKEGISMLDMTYCDRIFWNDYIENLTEINNIMNISTPPKYSDEGYNNLFCKFSFQKSSIGSFGFINVNSASTLDDKQLISIEINLRGKVGENSIDEWIEKAHQEHFNIFENLFTEEIKSRWK